MTQTNFYDDRDDEDLLNMIFNDDDSDTQITIYTTPTPLSNESNLTEEVEEVTNTSNTQIAIYTSPTPISKARLPETAVELLIIAQREEGILYSWTNIEWVKIIKNITDVEVTVSKVVEIGSLAAMVSGFLGLHLFSGYFFHDFFKYLNQDIVNTMNNFGLWKNINKTRGTAGWFGWKRDISDYLPWSSDWINKFYGSEGVLIEGALGYSFTFIQNFAIFFAAILFTPFALIYGTAVTIKNIVLGPSFPDYALPIFKLIYKEYNPTGEKLDKLNFFYLPPNNKYDLGIRIPIYSKNFRYDEDLIKLFHIQNNNFNYHEEISSNVNDIHINVTIDQACSFLRHQFHDVFILPVLFGIIAAWNQKKENLLHATQEWSINLFQDFLYKRDDTFAETYDWSGPTTKKILTDGSITGHFICRGPLFVGFLVSYEKDDKGNETIKPYKDNKKLTDVPVYLKENGWFTTGQKHGFINCNPLKKKGSHSCWEPQMNYENEVASGFYFLDMLWDAPWHDLDTNVNCDLTVPTSGNLISSPTPLQNGGSKIYKISYSKI